MTKLAFGRAGIAAITALAAFGTLPVEVYADETGLAQALHDVRREGRKLCLVDHFHDGNSAGQPSRKLAQAAAIRAWAEFTAFEYGTSWANWRKAGSKKVGCESSSGSWGCNVTARPCR